MLLTACDLREDASIVHALTLWPGEKPVMFGLNHWALLCIHYC